MRFCSICVWLLITVALVTVLVATLSGQAARMTTRTADLQGDDMTLYLKTNQFVFTGHCKLIITGPYQATMTSAKMTFKLSSGADDIEQLATHGPTDFSVVTQPDEEGNRYQITATSRQGATYSGKQQKVVLSGGATADIVTLPEGPDSQRAHITGETITADLKTSVISVNKAHLRVETPLEGEQQ